MCSFAGGHFAAWFGDPVLSTSEGKPYELHASFFLGRFGGSLDAPAQYELRWLAALLQPPIFFHECHRWAVQQGLAARAGYCATK
jgi:hypothetical protein